MPQISVMAKLVVRDDAIKTVKAELLKLVAISPQEEGYIEYRLHHDNDDPSVFIFYENWKSPEHLDKHMKSQHFQNYQAAVEGMIVERVVHKMTELHNS